MDEGIGMSQDDQKKLFMPFFKSSSAENRAMHTGGHGLGLSICKLLAEKLDGSLKVSSEEGKGTSFVFAFKSPIEEVAQYNTHIDPRLLLHSKANRHKRRIKFSNKNLKMPVLDEIKERPDDDLCDSP